jgi:hypothetical protein
MLLSKLAELIGMGEEKGSSKEHSTCKRPNITGSYFKFSPFLRNQNQDKVRIKPLTK